VTGLAAGVAARAVVPAAVRTIPWKLIFDGAIALAFLALLGWALRVNDLRDRWHHQYTSEHAGRLADRTAYRNAQATAAAQNKAHVANVEAQQQRISDNVETRYRADLARLRAQRGIVQQANPAPQRPTSGTASPAPGTATGGPDPKAVPLPPAELLRAQETELQLNALIDWVLGQSAVDPNAR
jgi:hypothetical protein